MAFFAGILALLLVFVAAVIAIFFAPERAGDSLPSYKLLAVVALVVGGLLALVLTALTAWDTVCNSTSSGAWLGCLTLKLETFLLAALFLEPFPIVAAVLRRYSLAARTRGDLKKARLANVAGLVLVLVAVAFLVVRMSGV